MNELSVNNIGSWDIGATFVAKAVNTDEERKALANALNHATHKLSHMINNEIVVTNIIIEKVVIDKDGESSEAVRTLIIDENGESYSTCSNGVLSSLRHIFAVYGMPDSWVAPITLKVRQIDNKDRRIFVLEVV